MMMMIMMMIIIIIIIIIISDTLFLFCLFGVSFLFICTVSVLYVLLCAGFVIGTRAV